MAYDGPLEWPYLEQFSDIPLYNTKAVVQRTGVPAPTLRAWERRYALISPERMHNTYRLYSERDVALIRWLKERTDSGMAISQAVALFRHLQEIQRKTNEQAATQLQRPDLVPGDEQVYEQMLENGPPEEPPAPTSLYKDGESVRILYPSAGEPDVFTSFSYNMQTMQGRLIVVLQNFDEQAAHMIMGSVFSLYPLEQVCTELIAPTMWAIGQLWAEGKVSASVEHFASFFFHSLLSNIFHMLPNSTEGELVIACCAPGESHDLPALMLALFLRRSKLRVAYLGQNIETSGLLHTIRQLSPAAICVSLTIPSYISALIDLGKQIQNLRGPRPTLIFSGQAFLQFPQYIALVPGTYINGNITDGVQKIAQLVSQHKNDKQSK